MRDKIITFKAKAQAESVDLENRVIRNVIMAQAGEAKGHGISVEQKFIDAVVTQSQNEVLSNFGHNWDNMGLQLGRVKNVHSVENKAVGDLHIYNNADNSPRFPNMGTWVMQQAAEDPESLMLSISFKSAYYYQYDNSGTEIKLSRDRWGDPIPTFSNQTVFVALGTLLSVDVVDSGALTDTLYSSQKTESPSFFQAMWQFLTGSKMKDKEFEMSAERGPDDVDGGGLNKTEGGGTNDGAIIWVGDKQFTAESVTKMLAEIAAVQSGNRDLMSKNSLLVQKLAEIEAENIELKAEPAATPTNAETGIPQIVAAKANDPEISAFAKGLRSKAGI
jgi:hypothetical protein